MHHYEQRLVDATVKWDDLGRPADPPARISRWTRAATETTVRSGSGYYYSDPTMWSDYSAVVDALRSQLGDKSSLGNVEADECDKFVCWRQVPRGSLVQPDGFPTHVNSECDELLKTLEWVLEFYLLRSQPLAVLDAVLAGSWTPLNKHKGYPDHTSGYMPDSIRAHLALTMACLDGSMTSAEVQSALSDAIGLPMYATLFARISGSSKWILGYEWKNGWLQPHEERKGYWARSRVVFGQSFWHNVIGRRYMGLVKSIIQKQPQHQLDPHAISSQMKRMWEIARRSGTMDSQDLKAFDTSVGKELQIRSAGIIVAFLKRHFSGYAELLGLGVLEEVLQDFARLPLLGCHVDNMHAAFLWNRGGTLSSGRCDTSIIGTLLNVSRVWASVARHSGLSLSRLGVALGRDWDYMIWGDDTVIAAPEKWLTEEADEYGFKSEGVRDIAMFLSRRWLPDGHYHSLLSRMYINTINKEERKEPKDPAVAMLGCKVRSLLLRRHPQRHLFEQAMRSRPLTRKAYDQSQTLTDAELQSALLKYVAKKKLDATSLEQLESDLAEAGYSDTTVASAIAQALGESHAFGYWHKEVDTTITVKDAISTLTELGKQAP